MSTTGNNKATAAGVHKRPPGRAPGGKTWDAEAGCWADAEIAESVADADADALPVPCPEMAGHPTIDRTLTLASAPPCRPPEPAALQSESEGVLVPNPTPVLKKVGRSFTATPRILEWKLKTQRGGKRVCLVADATARLLEARLGEAAASAETDRSSCTATADRLAVAKARVLEVETELAAAMALLEELYMLSPARQPPPGEVDLTLTLPDEIWCTILEMAGQDSPDERGGGAVAEDRVTRLLHIPAVCRRWKRLCESMVVDLNLSEWPFVRKFEGASLVTDAALVSLSSRFKGFHTVQLHNCLEGAAIGKHITSSHLRILRITVSRKELEYISFLQKKDARNLRQAQHKETDADDGCSDYDNDDVSLCDSMDGGYEGPFEDDDAGMMTFLLGSPNLESVKFSHDILDEGKVCERLNAMMAHCPRMTSIDLSDTHAAINTVLALASRYPNLEAFAPGAEINGLPWGREGDECLADVVKRCPKLLPNRLLSFGKGDKFIQAVAETHPNLESLDLRQCTKVTAAGLAIVGRSFPSLKHLFVNTNKVHPDWPGQSDILTDDILAMLAAGCPQLMTFDLKTQCDTYGEGHYVNTVTDVGILAVVEACPNVDVERLLPRPYRDSQSVKSRDSLLQAIAAARA